MVHPLTEHPPMKLHETGMWGRNLIKAVEQRLLQCPWSLDRGGRQLRNQIHDCCHWSLGRLDTGFQMAHELLTLVQATDRVETR